MFSLRMPLLIETVIRMDAEKDFVLEMRNQFLYDPLSDFNNEEMPVIAFLSGSRETAQLVRVFMDNL